MGHGELRVPRELMGLLMNEFCPRAMMAEITE